jgi:DNA-binding PadR family transcriptional regulator
MLEVEANTQGVVKMGPGTLYGSIKRMLAGGLIEEWTSVPTKPWTTSAGATID